MERPCAKEGGDSNDPMESERSGFPMWIDGKESMEFIDPLESDRRGAARRRFGNEMMDTPLELDSFLNVPLLSSFELIIV
mmetsp:Transcript_14236/g.21991  ORF Transcript_14236/g.21991 Transcript_14236/m.21991 type:complete len:80 (-) Transcript_14236:1341-1580(-)